MVIYAEPRNKLWLARELRLYPQYHGIDLADDTIGVEMKSRWRKYPSNFTIHDYQVDTFRNDNQGKELFWAFLLYDISIRGSGWRIRDREVWLMPWEFADPLPVSVTPNATYRYSHRKSFPDNFVNFNRPGGIMHVPKDSVLEERLSPPETARVYTLKF